MKNLVEYINESLEYNIPEIDMDTVSQKHFSEEQWKTIIAAFIVLVGSTVKISSLKFKGENPGDIVVTINYTGRKMNRSNNLWVCVKFKDAIRGMDKFIRGVDDQHINHTVRDNLAQVNIRLNGNQIGNTWKAYTDIYKEQESQIKKIKDSIKL